MTAVLSVSQRIIYIIISRSIYLNFCVYTPQVSVDSEGVLKRVPRKGTYLKVSLRFTNKLSSSSTENGRIIGPLKTEAVDIPGTCLAQHIAYFLF